MPVRSPSAGVEIDFNISLLGDLRFPLDDGSPEIRPCLAIPESWVQNSDGASIDGSQPFAPDPLVQPQPLEQLLRRWAAWWMVMAQPWQGIMTASIRASWVDLQGHDERRYTKEFSLRQAFDLESRLKVFAIPGLLGTWAGFIEMSCVPCCFHGSPKSFIMKPSRPWLG